MLYKLQSWLSRQLQPPAFIEQEKTIVGKIIVVTGTSRGIGKAIAEFLSKKGAMIIKLERNIQSKQSLKVQDKFLFHADVTDPKAVNQALNRIESNFGKIDVVINCAGIFLDKVLDETSTDDFSKVLSVNVAGAFNLARFAVPIMKKKRKGLIINIGSKISHNTNVAANKVTYATSKYALEGFSFALNKELKPFGIRVCCLMPGTVGTFVSRKSKEYLSPYEVASIVKFIIEAEGIDFESIIFKSVNQNI